MILNEKRYTYVINGLTKIEDNMYFITSKRQRSVPVAIIIGDGVNIKDSYSFDIIITNPSKLKKVRDELRYKINNYDDEYEWEKSLVYAFTFTSSRGLEHDMKYYVKNTVEAYPELFNDKLSSKNLTREQLFLELVRDMGMTESYFETYFFDKPNIVDDDSNDDIMNFHGGILHFQSNMRKNKKELFLKFISVIENSFRQRNLDMLFDGGNIYITPIQSTKIVGLYHPKSNSIKIDSSGKINNFALYTIFHEYGHKYFNTVLDVNKNLLVKEKFYEVVLRSNSKTQYEKFIQAIDLELRDSVVVGDTVEYIGRKKKFQNFSPFIIDEVDKENNKIKMASKEFSTVSMSCTIKSLLFDKDFIIVGKDNLNNIESVTYTDMKIVDSWIPREYAKTNYEEWFCELFACYMMGTLRGEPLEFIKEVLS